MPEEEPKELPIEIQLNMFDRSEEGQPQRLAYGDLQTRKLGELTALEIDRAAWAGELTPNSDVGKFERAAKMRVNNADTQGWRSAGREAVVEAKLVGSDGVNPHVLMAPDPRTPNEPALREENWLRISHARHTAYKEAAWRETVALEHEVAGAHKADWEKAKKAMTSGERWRSKLENHQLDPEQKVEAERLKQDLKQRQQGPEGQQQRKRESTWEKQESGELGQDKTKDWEVAPGEERIR